MFILITIIAIFVAIVVINAVWSSMVEKKLLEESKQDDMMGVILTYRNGREHVRITMLCFGNL